MAEVHQVVIIDSGPAGLTAAILHSARIEPLHKIDQEVRQTCEDLIFDRRREGYDPLHAFIALFEGRKAVGSEKLLFDEAAIVAELGLPLSVKLVRPGFFPKGGGEILALIPGRGQPKPLRRRVRGNLRNIRGRVFFSRMPRPIAERMAKDARRQLRRAGVAYLLGVPTAIVLVAAGAPGRPRPLAQGAAPGGAPAVGGRAGRVQGTCPSSPPVRRPGQVHRAGYIQRGPLLSIKRSSCENSPSTRAGRGHTDFGEPFP